MRETIWEQFEHAPEWKPHFRLSFKRIQLVDGTQCRSLYLMQRAAPNGDLHYRRMTKRELFYALADALPRRYPI